MSGLPDPPTGNGAPSDEGLFAILADLVDLSAVAELMAVRLRLPLVEFDGEIDPAAAELVAAPVAIRCGAAPVALQGHTLAVVTANPLDLDMVKTIEFASGRRVRVRVATPEIVRRTLARIYGEEPPAGEKPSPALVTPVAEEPEGRAEPRTPTPAVPPAVVADESPMTPVALASRPHGVLVVAVDPAVRDRVASALRAGDASWLIMTAQDEHEAALLLAVAPADVVVIDGPTTPAGPLATYPVERLLVTSHYSDFEDVIVRTRAVLDSVGAG